MIEITDQSYNYILLIDLKRLQSKLALIDYDTKKASELLEQAKNQADKYGLNKLANDIINERQQLEGQKELWQESKQKEPVQDRLDQVDINHTLKKIKEKSVIEHRNEKTGDFVSKQKIFAIRF